MKVVLAVDAIFPPLTGIGRYAYELATRLQADTAVESVRFFSWGRWLDDVEALCATRGALHPSRRSITVPLRKWAARKHWAVDLLSLVGPAWLKYRVGRHSDYLYHSPNYFLPPGTGPAVATVHDLSIYHFPKTHPAARVRYFQREFPKTLQRAAHLITDSQAVRREVIEMFGWSEDRITAIPLGVDASFHPRSEDQLRPILDIYGLEAGQYALCVSTLEPRKNIMRLLSAYESLPGSLRRSIPLVIAGGRGWLSGELESRLDRAASQGWVRLLGYLPQHHLPHVVAGAHTACLPSLYEGFGLPVLEAMASGVPVLTSNRSSLPEVAAGASCLVEPEDEASIGSGLIQVLSDEAWRAEARSRGLSVAAEMTWDHCVQRTVQVYRRVSEESGSGYSRSASPPST